jgi:hypothetical protein
MAKISVAKCIMYFSITRGGERVSSRVTISCSFVNSPIDWACPSPLLVGPALHLVRLVFLCYFEAGVLGSRCSSMRRSSTSWGLIRCEVKQHIL